MKEQFAFLFQLAAKIIQATLEGDEEALVDAILASLPWFKDAFQNRLEEFAVASHAFGNLPGFAEFRAFVEAAREFGAGQTA